MNKTQSNTPDAIIKKAIQKTNDYVHTMPAIRLGNSLASLEKLQGKTWVQIEPEARRLWEAEHNRPWREFAGIVKETWQETKAQFNETTPASVAYTTFEAAFHRHYQAHYAHQGQAYSTCAKAYYYGFDLGVDRRLAHISWATIEPVAAQYWQRQNSGGDWIDLERAAHFAWMRARDEILQSDPLQPNPGETIKPSDEVDQTAWQSFPASDPPAWTLSKSRNR